MISIIKPMLLLLVVLPLLSFSTRINVTVPHFCYLIYAIIPFTIYIIYSSIQFYFLAAFQRFVLQKEITNNQCVCVCMLSVESIACLLALLFDLFASSGDTCQFKFNYSEYRQFAILHRSLASCENESFSHPCLSLSV